MYNLRVATFTHAYFDAIVFTDSDNWEKDAQLSQELSEKGWSDCKSFLAEYGHMIATKDLYTAGADFWLTRNRHGSGFWAYPEIYGDYTQALTDAAKTFSELDTYDREGLIYF